MTLFVPEVGDLDPALLAFVKCHVTSALKWETLRVLATQEGRWLTADEMARATHKDVAALTQAIDELTQEGVVESMAGQIAYRLPPNEPTTLVLTRLIVAATHNQELRSIIANYLLSRKAA